MEDKDIPQSVGEKGLEPIYFPRKDDVCRRLDEFYATFGVRKGVPPSSMFLGALHGMHRDNRKNNPDWMAQVAHSLREIFYELGLDWIAAFKNYGSTYDEKIGVQKVGEYRNFIREIAHHNFNEAKKSPLIGGSKDDLAEITSEKFESVILQFGDIIFAVLRKQIDAHREIDAICKMSPVEASIDQVRELVNINPDARQYFYAKADERWLEWLWSNGFLDVIKRKAKDSVQRGYGPETEYLVKAAKLATTKAVDIILSVVISKENFNLEIIDQFQHICSGLPADQLARVIKKIRDEKWISLMAPFHRWGFQYEKMFKVLAEAKDFENTLILAEAVLAIRTKKDKKQNRRGFSENSPFYLNDLTQTKVLNYLIGADEKNSEKALAILTSVLSQIILLDSEEDKSGVFKIYDRFSFYDVDFFTLEFEEDKRLSYRGDIKNLAAVIKQLALRTIQKQCDNADFISGIFKKYFASLPDCRAMWRLQLYILSLCPETFKNELKQAFFRLFKTEHYHEILSGTEYENTLRIGFTVLTEDEKREYVKKVIEYFTKKSKDPKEEKYLKRHGSNIFSMIIDQLTADEKIKIKKEGFALDAEYKPEPSIGKIRAGIVTPQGPLTLEEFGKLPIAEIAHKLRSDWKPENLSKQNKGDDFFRPVSAEGVNGLLRGDMPKRFQEYINSANSFFERETLDAHYTYSFLRSIQETLRENKAKADNWDNFFELCGVVIKSGKIKPFDQDQGGRNAYDSWLAGWDAAHSAMNDAVKELIDEKGGSIKIDFLKYRSSLLEILDYLLSYPDPTPEDEKIESAKSTTKPAGESDYVVSDPFSMAVNSVRGRAYESLVLFLYQDGKNFTKDDSIKISSDVKELYEKVLKKENTRAIMFMFGHYLPSFYFRDKAWARGLLPQIFSTEPEKKYFYVAAWEGYLSNNLYEELFFDSYIKKLYESGLNLAETDYPNQKHFREPEEGMATHLALAFMYYKDFGFRDPLFVAFWKKNDPEQHAEFISFLGRMFVSGSNQDADELLKKDPLSKRRLKDLWDKMLKDIRDAETLTKFGFWINLKKDIFSPVVLAEYVRKTLEKTNGGLEWEYGLQEAIIELTNKAPEDTLEILRLYWLDGTVYGKSNQSPFHVAEEWVEAFRILHNNPKTKRGVYNLIDSLIRDGGDVFWVLEEIIKT
ncbi:MAG: hypothetical protein V1867_06845 [Candidatus Falkowbacteria bacterium]